MKLYKIKKSKIDNKRGLYATKDIKEGTKIINYIGKIITNREVEESTKFDKIIKSKKRINCAPPAPAAGLYLTKVIY